jgi:hypothetical protein
MMDTSEPAETPARRAIRRRAEFVAAFVEHPGPVPASERASVSLSTLITVTAVVSALTIVAGVFWSLIKPGSSSAASTAAASAAAAQYTVVAGWGCTAATDRGFDAVGRDSAWRTVAGGGWASDGCRGQFETIPMTGKATTDDPKQYVQWWFTPTTGTQCGVEIYIPKSSSAADTGAQAAHYAVMAGRTGATYADFVIDESSNTGRWVNAGAFPLHGSELAVRLSDRGVPQKAGYRLAVSAVRVTCGA